MKPIRKLSTVKLISERLDYDLKLFFAKEYNNTTDPVFSYHFYWVAGIIYLAFLILFTLWLYGQSFFDVIPKIYYPIGITITIFHLIFTLLFFHGFYKFGKEFKYPLIKISSLIILLIIPLFDLSIILSWHFSFAYRLMQLITILLGVNNIIFGIGLLLISEKNRLITIFAGIFQIVAGLLYLIPNTFVNTIGIFFSMQVVILLILIIYRVSKLEKEYVRN